MIHLELWSEPRAAHVFFISDKKGTFHFHFSDKIHIKRNFLKKGTKWQSLVNSRKSTPDLFYVPAPISESSYFFLWLFLFGQNLIQISHPISTKNKGAPRISNRLILCYGTFPYLVFGTWLYFVFVTFPNFVLGTFLYQLDQVHLACRPQFGDL